MCKEPLICKTQKIILKMKKEKLTYEVKIVPLCPTAGGPDTKSQVSAFGMSYNVAMHDVPLTITLCVSITQKIVECVFCTQKTEERTCERRSDAWLVI
jgi:hypothetical protein